MSGSTCGGTYTLIADQDLAASGGIETYTFISTLSQQYYIYIAYYSTLGNSSNTGTFTITRSCTVPVLNDNCSSATLITTPYNSGTVSTSTATSDVPSASSSCGTFGYNLWYKVAGNNKVITASTCNSGTDFDTEVRVYTGTCISSMTEEVCDDDDYSCSASSLRSTVSWCSLSGTTYYISVGNYSSSVGTGNFVLSVTSDVQCTALPVELLYFDVKRSTGRNVLIWGTASEHNSDYFVVKSSTDGYNWKDVGKETAGGNSTIKIDYSMDHIYEENMIHYYKLFQHDYDGKYKEYGPISIDNRIESKKIIKVVNLAGQEVGDDYRGFVIKIYEDGTIVRTMR